MVLDSVFNFLGVLTFAVLALATMILLFPVALLTRFESHWERAKKKEDDWMSRRENYLK